MKPKDQDLRKRVFSLIAFAAIVSASGQEGMIGYWSFDKLQGDVFPDHSAQMNHATGFGPVLNPGIKGNALYFDGENDYVVIGDEEMTPPEILRNVGDGSISLWFRVDSIPADHGIAPILYYGNEEKCDFFDAANEGLIIEVGHSPVHYRSERLYFTMWKNGCTYPSFCYDSNDPILTGKWYHLVVVVGPDYNTGYLNGREMTNRRYNFGNETYSQFFKDAVKHERMWLGKGHWDRTVQHFRGSIDELRIYDRPLSVQEVKMLYSDTSETATSVSPIESQEPSFQLYPDPAARVWHYDLEHSGIDVVKWEILDMNGRTVLQYRDDLSVRGSLNVPRLEPGIYHFRFCGRHGTLGKQVIIQE